MSSRIQALKRYFSSLLPHPFSFRNFLLLSAPFLLFTIRIRLLSRTVDYYPTNRFFISAYGTLYWVSLISLVSLSMPTFFFRIVYAVFFLFYFSLFIANVIYYNVEQMFFSFRLLAFVGEGKQFLFSSLVRIDLVSGIFSCLSLSIFIYNMKELSIHRSFQPKQLASLLVVFILIHPAIRLFLDEKLPIKWNNFSSCRKIYERLNDPRKAMKLMGFYEFVYRDIYVTFIRPVPRPSKEDLNFLQHTYSKQTIHRPNNYTGLLTGKNLILLQLEGFDHWLFDNETSPHLYNLSRHSLTFSNHYSYLHLGGSTFNSEFCVNVGFMSPVTFLREAPSLNANTFPYSLSRLFQTRGYHLNAFHMNTREYYNRGLNYRAWNYEHFYSLTEEHRHSKDKKMCELDRMLILDPAFRERLFHGPRPFVHYIISFTIHMPFDLGWDHGKTLAKVNHLDPSKYSAGPDTARLYANETDYMVGLLLEALKDNDLYNNTAIVAYADHCLPLDDLKSKILLKNETGNLLNRTPFFIWASNLEPEEIAAVNSQLDILPTLLNLFGFEYVEQYYMGDDILARKKNPFIFFPDGAYIEGQHYSAEPSRRSLDAIKKNDLTLQFDYFKSFNQL